MQFGNTKTISGQVPWDSTTSSNVMQLTAYPFFDVPSGTTYSLEGTYNGVGANIQITDGTFSTLDELDLTFSVPSEMIGQTGATFILMFEDPDNNRDYFTYDVTGLTLAPDPTPRVNITSDTTNVTISPSTYATSKTATGQVPYDTTAQGNVLSVALTTSGTIPTGPYTIEVFAQGDVMQQPIWYVAGASTIPQSIPIPLTSSNVGTGKYITINISGANDPEFNIITIDTSALTLAPVPAPRVNVTSGTTGVTVTPATYSGSKTATGQVPYDTTTSANPITFNLTYDGTWSGNYSMVVFYWDEHQNRNSITQLNFTDSNKPASVTFNATTTNLAIAIGFTVIQNGGLIDDPEVDTSALTLEAAPTPPTPSAPDFYLEGLEAGLGDESYDFFSVRALTGDIGYSHKINYDDACCLEIVYDSATTVSGHTQYNYSAYSSTYYPGINYWQSPTDGLMIEQAAGMGGCTIMTRATNTNDLFNKTSPLQPTSGEFLSGIAGSNTFAGRNFSSQINAFGFLSCDFEDSSSPYHYILRDSTNPSGQKVNVANHINMIFAIAGADGTTIPQNDIVFKLYNSDGSDYIIINVDMSNVVGQRWPHYVT